MGKRRVILFACTSLIFWSTTTSVYADPFFAWDSPWAVTLLPDCPPGPEITSVDCFAPPLRAFGTGSLSNGISETTADRAFAQASSSSFGRFTSGSEAVLFTRSFTLSGSPDGWQVALNGELNGDLSAGGLGNSAFVRAEASITPILSIAFNDSVRGTADLAIDRRFIHQSLDSSGHFADGSYEVEGALTTGAGTTSVPPGPASAFFGQTLPGGSPGYGFAVALTASPIPEPSTFFLLSSGLALVAGRWLFGIDCCQ